MDENKNEPVKVFLVNPPLENPWRTQGDYQEEQRRGKIQFRITIVAMLISILGVVATAITAIESIKRMSNSHTVTANGIDSKLYSSGKSQLEMHIEHLKSGGKGEAIRWGTIRNLHYKFQAGEFDDTVSAVLDYEEDFSTEKPPFTKYARYKLNLVYAENKWHLTGGAHCFFAPTGEENPFPNWTPVTEDMLGTQLELRMDFLRQ